MAAASRSLDDLVGWLETEGSILEDSYGVIGEMSASVGIMAVLQAAHEAGFGGLDPASFDAPEHYIQPDVPALRSSRDFFMHFWAPVGAEEAAIRTARQLCEVGGRFGAFV